MKRLFVLLATLGALFFGGAIYAQQEKMVGSAPVLTTGDYRNLNWHRRVKLGTAPYVNPGLMDNVTVAYIYDIIKVLDIAQTEALVEKLSSGMIAAAIPSGGTLKVHAYRDPIWVEKYGLKWVDIPNIDKAKFHSVLKGQNVVFISQDEKLFNLDHKGKVVSWEKGVAITGKRASR